ncbi:hypothetical protein E3Q16_03255 [Wallemia mellicola]|nr:hypothetical protein E3Q16_03255 [Wallemia mellicola]
MTNQRSFCFNFWNGFLAIILPPVSVAITTNCENNGVTHVLLNIVLWTCVALPGIIHAQSPNTFSFWVLLKWDERLQKKSPEVIYVQQTPTNAHSNAPPQRPHISPWHQDVQYPPKVGNPSPGHKISLQHHPDVATTSFDYKSSQRHDAPPNYDQSQREAIV